MQRLAEFVVQKRVAIIVASILLAIACGLLIPHVSVEQDLTRYLPASSDTRQGLDAMAEEFGETSPVRVMYADEGLATSDSARAVIAADLEALENVSSVSTEVGEESTDGAGKVLFTVNLEGGTYSSSATEGLEAVRAYAERTGAVVAGTIVDVVDQQASLVVTFSLALTVLLIILLIMCASWVEPLLFLATIGIAVLLNLGTCVLLPSVSSMTFSIAAVLQLALSMDYSIMLTDRYRQERDREDDPARAMVRALRGGFAAIASSSLTTVAGMLCLLAMSFAIGQDMGVVLAKGVAFSLLCVLFVLPGLMVVFDGAIQRTRKPTPRPRMRGAARTSYAGRYAVLGCFAALAVFSFVAKGSTGIGFFTASSNPDETAIDAAFPPEQQIALLYNKNLDDTSGVLGEIEALEGVDEVQSYEGTIARQLTAAEMAEQTGMDEAEVRTLYYAYAHDGATGTMTVHDFATFVQENVTGSEAFASAVDADALAQVGTLVNLTDPEQIATERTASDMAGLLGVDESEVRQLYAYYFMSTVTGVTDTLTLPDFVAFLQSDVLANETLASRFDDETRTQLESLAKLTDTASVTAPLDAASMAEALGLDASLVAQVYAYRATLAEDPTAEVQMSVQEFLGFMVTTVAVNPQFGGLLDTTALAQLYQARLVVDTSVAGTELDATGLGEVLGMDPSQVEQLLVYRQFQQGGSDTWTVDASTLLTVAANMLEEQDTQDGSTGSDSSSRLQTLAGLVSGALTGKTYTVDEMAKLLGELTGEDSDSMLDADSIRLVYLYREGSAEATDDASSPTLSLEEFVGYAAEQMAEGGLFAQAATDAVREELASAQEQIDEAASELVGQSWARAVVTTSYGRDSSEMAALVAGIRGVMDGTGGAYHLVGDGAMGIEMQELFNREFDFITLLTAGTIFLIVALTFRSILMPLLLVLLIQTAVNLTMGLAALQGSDIYYIALMVVQAMLMGATIDYAILFTTCYREAREELAPREAVARAFPASIGTILTSGSILVFVLLAVGLTSKDVTTSEVCLTLAKGAAIAVVLVLVFLPGMLCALDRIVAGPRAWHPDPTVLGFGGAAGNAVAAGVPYAQVADAPESEGVIEEGPASWEPDEDTVADDDAYADDEDDEDDGEPLQGAHWARPAGGATPTPTGRRTVNLDDDADLAWPELADLAVTPPGSHRRDNGR